MAREEMEELLAAIRGEMAAQEGRILGSIHGEMAAQEGRILATIRGEIAAVRGEIAALEERLTSKFYQHVDGVAATLEESIRDSQTEVLRAVMSVQEANNMRFGNLEATDASVLARMAVMERRLLEIEKRLGGVA